VDNRGLEQVAKITGLVAKFRRHFLLCPTPFRRTFPSAATGKPEAAREGGDFGNETPLDRNRNVASASNWGPKSLGTEDRAQPPRGGRELPNRFGGTGGLSVLRPETAGGLTREVWGPRLRPRDPAAGLLRETGGNRIGRKAGTEPRTLRREWRPEDREIGGQPDGRKAGRWLEGRKTRKHPTKGRPGVGAG
jgi:hypothetical protein